jgi:hypothetical protein
MPFSSSRSDSQCGITRQLRNESFHFSTVYTSVLFYLYETESI